MAKITADNPVDPWNAALLREGEEAGFQVTAAPDGVLWSREGRPHVRFRLLRPAGTSDSPREESRRDDRSANTEFELSEIPLTIWVGETADEARCDTGPADFFLDAAVLENTFPQNAAGESAGIAPPPRARDEPLTVVESETFRSTAGDQCILAFESARLARDLRPGQFVNVALSPGPFAPEYRMVKDEADRDGHRAMDAEWHHLARVPLSMLRVYRESSWLPSGVGPLPPEFAYRLRPARADRVSVAIRDVGTGTRALCHARVGDALRVLGPLGLPERVPVGVRQVVLLGGGVGFAPLYAIAEQCHWRRIPTTFLAGARVQEHLFPWLDAPDRFIAPEFQALDLRLLSVTEEKDRQFATDLLADHLESNEGRETDLVYVCGPTPMMARAAAVCESAGIACRAFLEKRMECSIGVCMSCVVRYRRDDGAWANVRVCREGTVFDASRVKW